MCSNIGEPTHIFHVQINSLRCGCGRLLTTVCCSLSLFHCAADDASSHSWESLPDPGSLPPIRESGSASLYTAIRKTVAEEIKIVYAIFPNPSVDLVGVNISAFSVR
jgi:hypothetical protein